MAACRNGKADDKSLNELMKTCERQLDSFCEKALAPVAWGKEQPGSPPPIYAAVEESSRELLKAYQQSHGNVLVSDSELEEALAKAGKDKVDPEALRKELTEEKRNAFKSLRKEFLGTDSAVEQKEKPVAPAKEVKTVDYGIVSTVNPAAVKCLEDVHAAFENSKFGSTEDAVEDTNLEETIRHCDELVEEVDKETHEKIMRSPTDKEKAEKLGKAQEAVFARLGSMTKNLGSSFVDSVRLLQRATRLPDGMKPNEVPKALGFGINENLGSFKIAVGDVVQAFGQADSVERNAKMLSTVYGRFQSDFGMSKDEVRRFVDPVCVAIVSQVLGHDINDTGMEIQIDMILRCTIAKAQETYANSAPGSADNQAAHVLLWKMQTAVTQAQELLAPLKELVTEEKDVVSYYNQKLKSTAVQSDADALKLGSSKLKVVNELLSKRAGSDATETRRDVRKTYMFGMIDRLTQKKVSFDQTGRRDNARFEQSKGFWERSKAFLWRLERLDCTLGGKDKQVLGEPKEVDPASRKFVDNVKARFGGDPIVDKKGVVNQERFTQLVGTFDVKGSWRDDYSLSFNFE